jgi:ATP synthase protein I
MARESTLTELPGPDERSQYTTAGMAWGMGCSVVASILICILGGLALDKILNTTPVLTLIGVALGLILAGYQLWELAQLSSKNGKVGPVARTVARVQSTRNIRSSADKGSE